MNSPLRVLHTSDWHIGRALYGRHRYDEFEAFLGWMIQCLQEHKIDILVVAGDIFDTGTPSNRAQELYYRFLCQISSTSCRHVVVVAGNHDSPSFLNAPKELLKAIHVQVVGQAMETIKDEVFILRNKENIPELIVCAVPYLRDRDIRTVDAGESLEDKDQKLMEGIRQHYESVADEALKCRAELGMDLPIIATGHLFAAGGQTVEGDGVRELYVGTLAHVHAAIFSPDFDYVALGHLHIPQKVGGSETIRYSGSPLAMGFGEAQQQKMVCLLTFDHGPVNIEGLHVPKFRQLEQITGNWQHISTRLQTLVEANTEVWLEIVYHGDDIVIDLRERLDEVTKGSPLQILRVQNRRHVERVLEQNAANETLDDLNEVEVFQRCLDAHNVPLEQRAELEMAFGETLKTLQEVDVRAE